MGSKYLPDKTNVIVDLKKHLPFRVYVGAVCDTLRGTKTLETFKFIRENPGSTVAQVNRAVDTDNGSSMLLGLMKAGLVRREESTLEGTNHTVYRWFAEDE